MAIPFVRDFDFDYGKPAQVSPLVTRVIADNPGPFTFTGTGVYIIGSGGVVAVIDPGPDTPAHKEALINALSGKKVSHILVTHHHADHSPLAAPLAQLCGCQVYGFGAPKRAAQDGQVRLEAGDDLSFQPDIEIRDGFTVSGPDWTLMAMHTPGHTSNHLCFALPEENTLFTGDHIMGWSTTVISPPDGDMGDYLASLERVYKAEFDRLLPTHGPPIEDPQPFIRAYSDHRLERETQILCAIDGGNHDAMAIVKAVYTDIDPRLYPAAAHSVLAHLIHLRENGDVRADGPDGLKTRYYRKER